jgi:hypothetical protein
MVFRVAIVDEPKAKSVDEQLGSPGFTFEAGWVLGIVIGFVLIVMIGHRRKRASQKSADTSTD